VDVVQLPEARADVAIVTSEEVAECRIEDGGLGGREFPDESPQEGEIGGAVDEGRQAAGSVEGRDKAPCVVGSGQKVAPTQGAELSGAVDQDRVKRGHRVGQLPDSRPIGPRIAPLDSHQDSGPLQSVRELFQKRRLAAALGADDCDLSAERVDPPLELPARQRPSPVGEVLDPVSGKRVVGWTAGGGGAHEMSISTGCGPIFRSSRSVAPFGCTTSSMAQDRVISLPENE